jgi:hypothetical protein
MRSLAVAAFAMCLSGCSLIDSSGIHYDYQFDPHDFVINLGDNGGSSVPSVPCQPQPSDSCQQVPQSQVPAVMNASTTLACDASSTCAAKLELRKALPIDLRNAMTPLPSEAVTLGINLVDLRKIDYWVVPPGGGAKELNVATPPIDLYVAPMAAKDEHDPQATLLGTVGTLPAGSTTCSDPQDPQPPADPNMKGFIVCEVPLSGAGKDALGGFVKNFRNAPFQIIAHTVITVAGGTPLPSGSLDFFVQPTVALSIIK